MPTLTSQHFDESLQKYQARDPELFRELKEKISRRPQELATAARLLPGPGRAQR